MPTLPRRVGAVLAALAISLSGLIGIAASPAQADHTGCACTIDKQCTKVWVYVNGTEQLLVNSCTTPPAGWSPLFYEKGGAVKNGFGVAIEQRVYVPPPI